jgi:hypothetical protein
VLTYSKEPEDKTNDIMCYVELLCTWVKIIKKFVDFIWIEIFYLGENFTHINFLLTGNYCTYITKNIIVDSNNVSNEYI